MHVAQADGVACLAAVKACVLSDSDADVITKRINDCGANAATGSAPCNDEAVTAEQRQIAYQITFKKRRSAFAYIQQYPVVVARVRKRFCPGRG